MCKVNGKKLGKYRTAQGFTQAKIAEELGVHASEISKIENGHVMPNDELVNRMCMILKINKDDIEIHDVGFDFLRGESKRASTLRSTHNFIRLMTPEETEEWINKKRKFSDEEEIEEVKTALKFSTKTGNKKYIIIDARMIHIPEWQRETDMIKVNGITENFNENKYDPIKVYILNGKLYVADGAHRVIAYIQYCEKNGIKNMKMQIEILSCDEHEAILTFLAQGVGRKTMSVADMYRAGIKGNIPEYIHFKDFFETKNIQITTEKEKLENPIGTIRPSSNLLRLVENDREILDSIVTLISKLGWSGSENNVFVLRNFSVIKRLYAHYGKSFVNDRLMKKCKGAFYSSFIFPIKSNSELYDYLEFKILK